MYDNLKRAAEVAEKMKLGMEAQESHTASLGMGVGIPREEKLLAQVEVPACHPFSAAVHHLIYARGKASRAGWNGSGMHVEAQWPDAHSKMGNPYFFIETSAGVKTPWAPSQTDLFATDWALLPTNYCQNYPF